MGGPVGNGMQQPWMYGNQQPGMGQVMPSGMPLGMLQGMPSPQATNGMLGGFQGDCPPGMPGCLGGGSGGGWSGAAPTYGGARGQFQPNVLAQQQAAHAALPPYLQARMNRQRPLLPVNLPGGGGTENRLPPAFGGGGWGGFSPAFGPNTQRGG